VYTEHAPAATARGLLDCTWTRHVHPDGPRVQRIVPDGCADLVWTGSRLFIAGPDTGPQLSATGPGTITGVRFAPGVLPALLGVPAAAVTDSQPEFAEFSAEATRLADTLAGSADPRAVLTAFALTRLDPAAVDPLTGPVLAGLRAGTDVGELAGRLGVSVRSLHRRSVAAFGYGPKVAQRILRFHRALALTRAGAPRAATAHALGYADQAHLAREVRALAGVTLADLR
jgi:AraC-like DNA-binding protein